MTTNDLALSAFDGTRIAYRIEGSGPPLVLTNGLTTSMSFWKYIRPIWLRRHTIVTWDLPGHGRSGPALSAEVARFEAHPRIIQQIMRATGIERAAQIGWSTGSQSVLETYRQMPALCQSLVLLLGGAGRALDHTRLPLGGESIDWLARKLPKAAFVGMFHALTAAFRSPAAPIAGRLFGLVGPELSHADLREVTDHIATVDPLTLQRMLCSSQEHDAHGVLSSLHVPCLIVAGEQDPFAPAALVGERLRRAAPGSELVRLAGATHTAMLEQPEHIAELIERFLQARGPKGPMPMLH